MEEPALDHLLQLNVNQTTPIEPTPFYEAPPPCANEPEMLLGSTIADDEHGVTTTGNSPSSIPSLVTPVRASLLSWLARLGRRPVVTKPALIRHNQCFRQRIGMGMTLIPLNQSPTSIWRAHPHQKWNITPPRRGGRVIDLSNPPEPVGGNANTQRTTDLPPRTFADSVRSLIRST